MKKLHNTTLLLAFFVTFPLDVYPQTAVVSAGGDINLTDVGSISASVGQTGYNFISNNKDKSLSAGIQQVYIEPNDLTRSSYFENKLFSLNIAPNPTTAFCFVSVQGSDIKSLKFTICDLNGHILQTQKPDALNRISFAEYPKGMYLLKVEDNNSNNENSYHCITFKIIKE